MRLLLTRPLEDSQAFAAALTDIGVETSIAPLMSIEIDFEAELDLDGVQAILMTSANGVRAFVSLSSERSIPVLAVGDASAKAARDAGFQSVESADGDVDDLARLTLAECESANGPVLHMAGSKVAGDLGGALMANGFDYRRAVVYAARQAESLPDEISAALRADTLDGVVLFSPRSAVILETLVIQAGLTSRLGSLTAFVLSENVANALDGSLWRSVLTATAPNADVLLKVVSAARQTG